jgi:hypothetical protein
MKLLVGVRDAVAVVFSETKSTCLAPVVVLAAAVTTNPDRIHSTADTLRTAALPPRIEGAVRGRRTIHCLGEHARADEMEQELGGWKQLIIICS